MRTQQRGGFTLIELLTVIAIISILFGLVAVAAPRVLEKAKIADTENQASQLRTSLATYQTTHGSLPPAYGYLKIPWGNVTAAINGGAAWGQVAFLEPYTSRINAYKVEDLYDHNWSESFDSDRNNVIDLFEFEPIPGEISPGNYRFWDNTTTLYPQPGGLIPPAQPYNTVRPFIYIPVNKEQARRVKSYFETQIGGQYDPERIYAMEWDWTDPWLEPIARQTPPPYYDAYVIISVGPGGSTGGIATPPPLPGVDELDHVLRYHVNGLRAYYLATRDLNDNGLLDFDFRARSRNNEGSPEAYANVNGVDLTPLAPHLLPAQKLGQVGSPYGPLIFHGQG